MFQYLVIVLLAGLVTATLRAALGGGVRKRVAAFFLLVWFVAGVAAIWPGTTVRAARALGIGRGADLVLYCSVFASMSGFFYVYARFRRLDRALTQLVRQLAVEHPVVPPKADPISSEPG
jgi:hypothetical protein